MGWVWAALPDPERLYNRARGRSWRRRTGRCESDLAVLGRTGRQSELRFRRIAALSGGRRRALRRRPWERSIEPSIRRAGRPGSAIESVGEHSAMDRAADTGRASAHGNEAAETRWLSRANSTAWLRRTASACLMRWTTDLLACGAITALVYVVSLPQARLSTTSTRSGQTVWPASRLQAIQVADGVALVG